MADFCKECSIDTFGQDFGDFADLVTESEVAKGIGAYVLCEGCGYIRVDHFGCRIELKGH